MSKKRMKPLKIALVCLTISPGVLAKEPKAPDIVGNPASFARQQIGLNGARCAVLSSAEETVRCVLDTANGMLRIDAAISPVSRIRFTDIARQCESGTKASATAECLFRISFFYERFTIDTMRTRSGPMRVVTTQSLFMLVGR